jgi:hypothetical protein
VNLDLLASSPEHETHVYLPRGDLVAKNASGSHIVPVEAAADVHTKEASEDDLDKSQVTRLQNYVLLKIAGKNPGEV